MQQDEEDYKTAMRAWTSGVGTGTNVSRSDEIFMPFSEYILGRETASNRWSNEWLNLQSTTLPRNPWKSRSTYGDANWAERPPVHQWFISANAEEIQERFGGFNAVDPNMIPVGMLSAFQNAKIAWES
jgi:hypothetical protein